MQADRPIDRHADRRAGKTDDHTSVLLPGLSPVSVYAVQTDMWAVGRQSGMMIADTPIGRQSSCRQAGRETGKHAYTQTSIHTLYA